MSVDIFHPGSIFNVYSSSYNNIHSFIAGVCCRWRRIFLSTILLPCNGEVFIDAWDVGEHAQVFLFAAVLVAAHRRSLDPSKHISEESSFFQELKFYELGADGDILLCVWGQSWQGTIPLFYDTSDLVVLEEADAFEDPDDVRDVVAGRKVCADLVCEDYSIAMFVVLG